MYEPVPGSKMFNALKEEKTVIMAVNPRITKGVVNGVFRAAKKVDSAVIFELARSECNNDGGYTGLTPKTFADEVINAAKEIKFDIYAIHADHIQIKTGDSEEIKKVKELIDAQINAGYTSFAIDASYLFNFKGTNVKEQLEPNIKATIKIAKYIKEKMGNKEFGLEVEVGEIGYKNKEGMVLTSPEEAVEYIKALSAENVHPNLIAIANGSTHGNIYDELGNQIAQVSIDIEQTKNVANALKENGFDVKIAQHGITGTPLEFISTLFPKGDILKGNVATFFQNIVFDALKIYRPKLYEEMFEWVIKNHSIPEKNPEEIFGKNGKYATKQFFDRIYAMSKECEDYIESKVYEESLKFFKAFDSVGTAEIVRKKKE